MHIKGVMGKRNKTVICIQENTAMCELAWETLSLSSFKPDGHWRQVDSWVYHSLIKYFEIGQIYICGLEKPCNRSSSIIYDFQQK